MSNLIRVYVAGSISDSNPLQVFENIRVGIKTSADLFFSKKYSPFCPFLDHNFLLIKDEDQSVEVKDFYNYSLAWLEQSEAILVLPGSQNSTGTTGEIKRAIELDIPVFYSREDLDEWATGQMTIDCQTTVNDLEI